jgi:hypothetical protein
MRSFLFFVFLLEFPIVVFGLPAVVFGFPVVMLAVFVDRFAAAAPADGMLLSGAAALDGGVGAACAVFAGAAGDLRCRGVSASPCKFYGLLVDDEHNFFLMLFMLSMFGMMFRVMLGDMITLGIFQS